MLSGKLLELLWGAWQCPHLSPASGQRSSPSPAQPGPLCVSPLPAPFQHWGGPGQNSGDPEVQPLPLSLAWLSCLAHHGTVSDGNFGPGDLGSETGGCGWGRNSSLGRVQLGLQRHRVL